MIALAAALAAMGCAATARAETLADAVTTAYETNPNIQAQRAAMRALDENYVQARAAFGLSASVSLSENDYEVEQRRRSTTAGAGATTQSTQLSVSQPLYTSGRYTARLGGIEAQIRGARENLRRIEMDLLVRATNVYVLVRRDQEILRISQGGATWLEKQLKDTEDKYSVRQVTLTDVQQARARLASARTQVANAEAQLSLSRAQYASIIGRMPENLEPEPDIEGLPTGLDEAFDVAEDFNPSLHSAMYTEKASRLQVAEARAQRLFSVTARVDYRNGPEVAYSAKGRQSTTDTSIVLSQPLFSSGQLNSQVRQALEENNRDQHLLDDARRSMVLNVSQAWDQLSVARRSLTSLEDEMKADTIAFYGVREEERFALRSTIEVLNAQAELQAAQVNFIRGRYNEYVSRLQLLAQIGTLEVGDIAPGVKTYNPEKNFKKVRFKGALPTEALTHVFDKIALPMSPKAKAGDTTPIRPASTEMPAAPIEAAKVQPPASINQMPALSDADLKDAPVKTAPKE
ncbi:TolC family outer membrane protein [Caulobacter sp.]|uniref:TolC family outer membrane protein n=1 Tax=Caulobacter sp. TaxID=78 RepID=UPI003BAC17E1